MVFVDEFLATESLAGARGNVFGKTGTIGGLDEEGQMILRTEALGGYIDAKSGRRLVFEMAVNEVPFDSLDDIRQIIQDQGMISAILWRDF